MKLDDVRKLKQKKYRQQFGCFLIEGEHLLQELEKTAYTDCEVYVTEPYLDWPTRFPKTLLNDKQMKQLADTQTPQGIMARVPIPTANTASNERAFYFSEIQDPGNLGTILRSMAWFGGARCLLSAGSVDPYNTKVVRSSMGAIFHVGIEQDVSLDEVARRYAHIGVLDMSGSPLSDGHFPACDCYIFGNEARGIPQAQIAKLAPSKFTISGQGMIESLNVASAVTISLYELNR